ncbi:hypothetical protein, partial [uncultured Senegalimassilia sp.]|uniref:hypothetical protein n=1 Tax=uncultured Senegalimassilia sp. TaxID=1714350 RepID=UPI0026030EE6
GSIPVTRSIKTPGQSLIGSGLFCLCAKVCAKCGLNPKKTSDLAVSGAALPGPVSSAAHQPSSARAILQKMIADRSAILQCFRDRSFSLITLS